MPFLVLSFPYRPFHFDWLKRYRNELRQNPTRDASATIVEHLTSRPQFVVRHSLTYSTKSLSR